MGSGADLSLGPQDNNLVLKKFISFLRNYLINGIESWEG
jgi:hypothetical protein